MSDPNPIMSHQPMPHFRLLSRGRRSGFTLTEIMIASAIALVVIAGVMAVVLSVTRTTRKTEFLADALRNTREVQEFLNREISSAISSDRAADVGLSFAVPNGSGRYARLSYRVPICNPLKIVSDSSKDSKVITLNTPVGAKLAVGDYIVIAAPATGNRLRVVSVSDPDLTALSVRDVTVTLSQTIGDATEGEKKDIAATDKVYVSVYRDRKFEVADPDTAMVTKLQWWENSSDSTPTNTLSSNVAATERYMFEPIPNDLTAAKPATEHSVRWHFTYQATGGLASGLLPGPKQFWERNVTEGVLWGRSGGPENPAGNNNSDALSSISTTTSTTSTTSTTTKPTTTSISTTSTTKTTTTSIKTTSTTKTTTTSIKTTSTKKTTTTSVKTTSTTKPSTTSVKTTSTTKPTTTSVKTTSTTKATTTTKQPTTVPQDG